MSSTQKIRILLADDHTILRDGLKSLFHAQPELQVVGEAQDGNGVLRLAEKLKPDLVVMDISMGGTGTRACRELKQNFPDIKILALTVHEDASYLNEMLSAGAAGYVLKRAAAEDLIKAVLLVASGGAYIDPEMSGAVVESFRPRSNLSSVTAVPALSPRELVVLRLLAQGFTQKEVAMRLGVSTKTVESHKANSMEKLGLSSRADLVRFGFQQGWLDELK